MKALWALLAAALFVSTSGFARLYPVTQYANPFTGSSLYVPNDSLKHTSIVMLHGSEGGSEPFIHAEANILAAQGYTVLTLCYFDCNRGLTGPRQTLKQVEATRVTDAVGWLRSLPQSNGQVAVYGFSRGAELTLLAGTLDVPAAKRPSALIAHSPSDVVNGSWNWSWLEPACWICKNENAQCTKDSPPSAYRWNPGCGPDDLASQDSSKSAWLIAGNPIPAHQRIQIEKFAGPILITVGDKDEVWPFEQTQRIEATLRAAGRNAQVRYFPGQGHVFRGPSELKRRQLVLDFLDQLQDRLQSHCRKRNLDTR